MGYTLNLGAWNAVFAVPCAVVDRHIRLAGSVQLKVLLWVLRHAGEPFEEREIADALGIERADVSDAMLYWRETGLIAGNGEGIAPAPAKEPVSAPAADPPAPAKESAAEPKPRRVLSRPQKPDNTFVARRISESTEIACLMQEAEQILGRLISNGDSATLLMIHDDFGLPSDVIIMLLQYAVSIGKASTRYIEKVALNWADEEIFTHEKAEEKLRRLAETGKAWRTVEQAVGMTHRAPSAREEQFASSWVIDWAFSPEMIREAYDRSVDGTGHFKMAYMNRILERWRKEGISTPKQAQQEKEAHASLRRDKKEPAKPTYDIEEYEHSDVFGNLDNFNRK